MRVLFVHQGENWIRGSERCMLGLAAGIMARGWESIIACNASAVLDEATTLGVPTISIEPPQRSMPWPRWNEVKDWRAILRELRPDIVHLNSVLSLPPLLVCGMLERLPVIVHQHILDDQFSRLYSLMHQASAIVTINETAHVALEDDGYPRERLHRIPNGVQVRARSSDVSVRALTRADDGDTVMASVGSLIHRKGHDRTIAAFALALQQTPTLHLALIGSGSEEPALRELAAALGVASRVHFLGQRSDVQNLLWTADFFVTGAREEVQPLSVIEAMLCGQPVVASNIPAHTEMVEQERMGLLVDADDARQFASAMVRAATDREWRSVASQTVATVSRERYSFDAYVDRFLSLYGTLMQAPRRRYAFPDALTWMPPYGAWVKRSARRRLFG
jgi:hypothetical protein